MGILLFLKRYEAKYSMTGVISDQETGERGDSFAGHLIIGLSSPQIQGFMLCLMIENE